MNETTSRYRPTTFVAWIVATALCVLAADPRPASAQAQASVSLVEEQARLIGSDSPPGDLVGCYVSLSGTTAVLAGLSETYVFEREAATWTERQKLVASDTGESLGRGVVDGDTILASGSDGARVFVRDGAGWAEQQTLVASDGTSAFSSLAIDGDTAALVANAAVYVFAREGTTWSEQQTIVVSNPSNYISRVAIDGDTIVAQDWSSLIGVVHVFVREGTTWSEQQVLEGDSQYPYEDFGTALAIDGDTLVVNEAVRAKVWVYERNGGTWSLRQEIPVRTVESLAIEGDVLAVGEYGAPSKLYVREGGHWFERQEIRPAYVQPYNVFGSAIALSEGTVLVGSPAFLAPAVGSAYVFAPTGVDHSPWKLFHYDSNSRWARTAEIESPNEYAALQDYPTGFGQWTHVAGSSTKDTLFFYNSSTGVAALGRIDLDGIFTTVRYWPPGTSFGAGWTHILWHGDNLFFYCSGNGLAAVGRIEGPNLDFHQYNTFRYLITGWTHVASVQGYLLFYNQSNGGGYACQLNPLYNSAGLLAQINFQYVRVQTFSTGWTHIVDSTNGVLFYNGSTGVYRIGDFDRAGYFTSRTAPWPPWSAYPLWQYSAQRTGWTQVVAVRDRLLFYNKNTGEGMTGFVNSARTSEAQRVEPLGVMQTYPWGSLSYPGSMRWSHIVPVAAQ